MMPTRSTSAHRTRSETEKGAVVMGESWKLRRCRHDALRFLVAAAFFPAARRFAVDWLLPPMRPPFLEEARDSVLPRPEPDFLPPPVSLFTVAQARAFAVFFDTP